MNKWQGDAVYEAFVADIAADPFDDTARLILADWLAERGDPDRAAYVRAGPGWRPPGLGAHARPAAVRELAGRRLREEVAAGLGRACLPGRLYPAAADWPGLEAACTDIWLSQPLGTGNYRYAAERRDAQVDILGRRFAPRVGGTGPTRNVWLAATGGFVREVACTPGVWGWLGPLLVRRHPVRAVLLLGRSPDHSSRRVLRTDAAHALDRPEALAHIGHWRSRDGGGAESDLPAAPWFVWGWEDRRLRQPWLVDKTLWRFLRPEMPLHPLSPWGGLGNGDEGPVVRGGMGVEAHRSLHPYRTWQHAVCDLSRAAVAWARQVARLPVLARDDTEAQAAGH